MKSKAARKRKRYEKLGEDIMPIIKTSSNISERGSLPESVGWIDNKEEKL